MTPSNSPTVCPPQFLATVLGATSLQTRSEGLDTGNLELKTWQFDPAGAAVSTEVIKEKHVFPITSYQVKEL